jgi:hypothetical protein
MIKVKRVFSKPQYFFPGNADIEPSLPHASRYPARNDTPLFSAFDIFPQIHAAASRSAPLVCPAVSRRRVGIRHPRRWPQIWGERFGVPKPAYINDVSDNRYRYKYARPFHTGKYLYPGREEGGPKQYLVFKQLNVSLIPFQPVQQQVDLKMQRRAGQYCPDSLPALFPKISSCVKPYSYSFKRECIRFLSWVFCFLNSRYVLNSPRCPYISSDSNVTGTTNCSPDKNCAFKMRHSLSASILSVLHRAKLTCFNSQGLAMITFPPCP